MDREATIDETPVEGLHHVHQARSRKSRDAFIESGFSLLNRGRLKDFTVSDLVADSGRSVGSFYKRFQNKDAFFRALCVAAVAHNTEIHRRELAVERLDRMPPEQAMDHFAKIQFRIFTGKSRGVLREALLRTEDSEADAWAPMREAGRGIRENLVASLRSRLPGHTPGQAERKIAFCYQVVVGVLQNDLVNDHLAFSSRDGSILPALQAVLRDHIAAAPG